MKPPPLPCALWSRSTAGRGAEQPAVFGLQRTDAVRRAEALGQAKAVGETEALGMGIVRSPLACSVRLQIQG